MSDIKISIIVPVYNTAELLPRCIESLLAQTLKDVEIILINDASTDNSLEIMRQYEKKYPRIIRIIDSKVNQRQGGARNLGIEAAQGQYIGFVDSDDWIEKEMYEYLYREIIKAHSDMCYCYRKQISEAGIISKDDASYFLPTGNVSEKKRREMIVRNMTFVLRYIYDRALFMKYDIRFPSHLRYEDMMIDPLALLYANHIAAVQLPMYNYFIHGNSTTTAVNDTKYKDKIRVCLLIIDEYKNRGYYGRYRDEINYLYFRKGYIHAALNYIINVRSPRKEVISEIRNQLLSIDKNYRNNPYYSSKRLFCLIDNILGCQSSLLLRGLKYIFKIMRYNV
jgi:glycosyltransferase involved in cell wall biosynthesis